MLKPKVWTEKAAEPKAKRPLMRLVEVEERIDIEFVNEDGETVATLGGVHNGQLWLHMGCEDELDTWGYDASWGQWDNMGKIKIAGYDG